MGRKQLEVPGTERETHPDVAKAAEKYIEARDARMELTKAEVETKNALVGLMKEHKLETYEDDDFIVTFEADVQEKIKAKRRAVVDGEIEVEA
jgi:hypothetical protein